MLFRSARIEPAQFGQMSFDLSPALGRFTAKTNVTSLWSSLRCDETPPAAERLALPIEVLVWRQAGASRFRILGAEEAMAVADKVAGFSIPVVMMIKESVNRAYETTLAEGVRFERRMFHAAFSLDDQKEGMSAFVAKRKPVFRHR